MREVSQEKYIGYMSIKRDEALVCKMTIGCIEILAVTANPHKEAVDLVEQQTDEFVRDIYQSGDICHE